MGLDWLTLTATLNGDDGTTETSPSVLAWRFPPPPRSLKTAIVRRAARTGHGLKTGFVALGAIGFLALGLASMMVCGSQAVTAVLRLF